MAAGGDRADRLHRPALALVAGVAHPPRAAADGRACAATSTSSSAGSTTSRPTASAERRTTTDRHVRAGHGLHLGRCWPRSSRPSQTVTDASDPAIRALMKLPASLADIGLAALVAYALRARPRWAVDRRRRDPAPPGRHRRQRLVGPVRVDLRAVRRWARSCSPINGRNGLRPLPLVAVSLMTKPQALPFLVPFAAWFWATGGCRERRCGPALDRRWPSIVVLWLPFIAGRRPGRLPRQPGATTRARSSRSSRCGPGTRGGSSRRRRAAATFIADDVAFLGPLTLRHLGYHRDRRCCRLVVALAVVRDPRRGRWHPRPGGVGARRVLRS